MAIFSFHFLTFLCLVSLAFHAWRAPGYRHALLTIANLIFLATYLQNWWNAAAMVLFVCGSYAGLKLLRARPAAALTALLVVLASAVLVFVKRYAFLELALPERLFSRPIELVGISYMTFKFIHAAVDLQQQQLDEPDFLTWVNYQLGFWCLAAGPIQRYNDFARDWHGLGRNPVDPLVSLRGWRRSLIGLLRMGVLGSLAWYFYDRGMQGLGTETERWAVVRSFLLVFYAYPAWVWFNFSGYCDVVIGAAQGLGIRHQENFNWPVIARNMLDFWNRWHISLTLWIRDYVFTPLYKWSVTRWRRHAKALGYLAIFLALLIAGIWHGSSWNFVAFGLVHGVGVAGTQMYGDFLKAKIGRDGVRQYLASPLIRALAIVITVHYVCFSFLFFRPGLRDDLALVWHAVNRIF